MIEWFRNLLPKPPPPTFPCGFCGSPLPAPAEKHQIGTVVYSKKKQRRLFCDATEIK